MRLARAERDVQELRLRPARGKGVLHHLQRVGEAVLQLVGDDVAAEVRGLGRPDDEVALLDGFGDPDEVTQQRHAITSTPRTLASATRSVPSCDSSVSIRPLKNSAGEPTNPGCGSVYHWCSHGSSSSGPASNGSSRSLVQPPWVLRSR